MKLARRIMCLAVVAATAGLAQTGYGQHCAHCGHGLLGNHLHGHHVLKHQGWGHKLSPSPNVSYAQAPHYHPAPVWARGVHGRRATSLNDWNLEQSQSYAWHGGYNYWRYGVPTGLVVPPTAAFQTEYNWGVAQTRSLPIYHQYGKEFSGLTPATPGMFSNTPYWPSSTSQFGVYPVRGPW